MVDKKFFSQFVITMLYCFSQLPRFNESLMATLLYLLNSPESRLYMRSDVGLEVCLFGCFIFIVSVIFTFIFIIILTITYIIIIIIIVITITIFIQISAQPRISAHLE